MFPQITEQDIFSLSTTPQAALGSIFVGEQGRKRYKYVQFGGTATINAGILLVAPAAPSNSTGLALSAQNNSVNLLKGSKQILIVNGATPVAANQFAEGTLEVLGANGFQSYRIAGNSADSVGAGVITVNLQEATRNASAYVVGTNTVNLRQNPAYNATPSLTQAEPVGVTIQAVPNTAAQAYFGWVQVGGDCQVFATTAVKGQPIAQDLAGTAGYAKVPAAVTDTVIGEAQESVASSLATVNLSIA